jgi:hypothetical protein
LAQPLAQAGSGELRDGAILELEIFCCLGPSEADAALAASVGKSDGDRVHINIGTSAFAQRALGDFPRGRGQAARRPLSHEVEILAG